jgi:osmotically-inducible protein OsmY
MAHAESIMYIRRRRETGTVRPFRSRLRAIYACAALLVCACFGSSLYAQNTSGRQDPHDIRIAVRARHVLSQDSQLADLNIGVSARQGAVTLWGRAPTQALAERARAKVKQVPGVFSVRSDLRIEPFEPQREVMPTLPLAIRVPSSSSPPSGRDLRSPGVLAGQQREREPDRPSLRDAARLAQPVPTQEPPAILMTPYPAEASDELKAAVVRIIHSDARFARVQPEVREGIVTLRGSVNLIDHAMELARQVSHLKGVESVVVDQVRAVTNP